MSEKAFNDYIKQARRCNWASPDCAGIFWAADRITELETAVKAMKASLQEEGVGLAVIGAQEFRVLCLLVPMEQSDG